MQYEIKESKALLDKNGNISEAGYAKKLLPIYRRADIKAPTHRIKEWDYYLINNEHYAVALTIDDNGYMGMDSISFINFDEGWEKTLSHMFPFPMGRRGLSETSETGDVNVKSEKYAMSFRHEGDTRVLEFRMNDFLEGKPISGKIVLTDEPEESMVIATPFDKKGHFYFNQKINCLRASGNVTVKDRTYSFEPESAFAVLDWGRGVWTYHNTWYWGNASGVIKGVPFGWNIGYGFGNCSAASENMLFYDGKAHKLSKVDFKIPRKNGKYDYMSPWTFTSDDSRLEMSFIPLLDRASKTSALVLMSDQHQVFGHFSGTAVLDDGTELEIRDLMGFAERVENKW